MRKALLLLAALSSLAFAQTTTTTQTQSAGGGSGTVNSSNGVSGNGSSGSPLALTGGSVPPVDVRFYFSPPLFGANATANNATGQDFGAVLNAAFQAAGADGACVDISGVNPATNVLYATTNPYVGMNNVYDPCLIGGNLTIVISTAWETPAGSFKIEGQVPGSIGASGLTLQPCNTTGGCTSPGGLTLTQYPTATSCAASGGLNCWATGLPSSPALQQYTTGTISVTNNNKTVTGSSTTFTSSMVGGFLLTGCTSNTCTVGSTHTYTTARIAAVNSATSITLEGTFTGSTASAQNYIIWYPNTPVVLCDGCLTTSAQAATTGHLFRNFNIDVNGVGGGVGYYTRAVQEGTEYDNVAISLQATSPTGAAAAGACAAWDNTLREAKGGNQTFTGHYFNYASRCGVGNNVSSTSTYGYIFLGNSLMDGLTLSSPAGPGEFDCAAVIGGTGSAKFQDAMYIDGLVDGRWGKCHIESTFNDDMNVAPVNAVQGTIFSGISSSGTLGNAVIEFHSGTSGNSVEGITRPLTSGSSILIEDDNLATPTVSTSTSTQSSWIAPKYTQAAQGSNGLLTSGHLNSLSYNLCADTSGSGTAQVCNTAVTFTPVVGSQITYTTTTANSGTGLTVNVNGLGAKSVAIPTLAGGWSTTLVSSPASILASKPLTLMYDGTNWNVVQMGTTPNPITGVTSGQIPVAGAGNTLTSSKALAGSGTAIVTGPTSSGNGDVVIYSGTGGQIADSGVTSGSIPLTKYSTQSSATNTNISATTMLTTSGGVHDYSFGWTVSLTTVGTSCTGSTTVVLNAIWTDPNTSSTTTLSLGTLTIATSGNGTVGYVQNGQLNILAKNGTTIQYSTTSYTAGSGCTVNPTYQVSPALVQLW